MKSKEDEKSAAIKEAHETSEKLAVPATPVALGAQVKLVAETHEKITGKKNWVTTHSIDLTIGIGFIWSIFRILQFFYPDRSWTIWVKFVDVFLPAIIMLLALIYRLYPLIDVFLISKNDKNQEK